MTLRLALFAAVLSCALDRVGAQTVLLELHGDATHFQFGYDVDRAGDVDADGRDDVIVSISRLRREVRVYSGADGGLLHRFLVGPNEGNFGERVTGLGDIDGDGHDDFAYSAPASLQGNVPGKVYVRSGRTGEVLHLLEGAPGEFFGASLDGVGDVDGDGRPDIAAGVFSSISPHTPDYVRIWSGRTGELLREIDEPLGGVEFGRCMSAAGDVDADGFPDILVGDPLFAGAGAVWVFSGLDGSTLHEIHGESQGDRFAWEVSGLGDVNSDGRDDFLVGTSRLDVSRPGEARVFSGATGELLYAVHGEVDGDRFGHDVAGLGDVDGDGRADFACGSDVLSSVWLFSGADGAPINRFPGLDPDDGLGRRLAAAGDVDGDGVPDLIAGTGNQFDFEGYALVLSGACLRSPERYCKAAANSASPTGARLGSSGYLSVHDDDFTLTVVDAPPSVHGLFVYGITPDAQPFGDGYLCISASGAGLHRLQPPSLTSPAGTATRSLSFPTLPPGGAITAGSTWCFQFLYRDPRSGNAGFNASDALRATFCP